MSNFVNYESGEMVGKGRSIMTRLGDPKTYVRGHRQFLSKLAALRASQLVEIAIAKKHRREPVEPPGLCHCGCGQRTTIATRNDRANGRINGQPMKFVKGHKGKRGH